MRVIIKGGEGRASEVEAVLDTGFSEYLSLPHGLIDALLLPYLRTDDAILSDGSVVDCSVHEATVVWDGQERVIPVHSSTTGEALIGMSLLLGQLVTLPVVNGGTVTITTIP